MQGAPGAMDGCPAAMFTHIRKKLANRGDRRDNDSDSSRFIIGMLKKAFYFLK